MDSFKFDMIVMVAGMTALVCWIIYTLVNAPVGMAFDDYLFFAGWAIMGSLFMFIGLMIPAASLFIVPLGLWFLYHAHMVFYPI